MPGELVPNGSLSRAPAPPAPERPIGLTIPSGVSKLAEYRPKRAILANGLKLLSERRPGTGVVALELFVNAGVTREGRPGLGFLAGRMLEEGTLSRSAEALAQAIEDVGGTLDLGATGASIRVRAEDLPLALEVLADVSMRPRFPVEALAWSKRRIASELQGDRDDPGFRADLLFRGLVYGAHPYGRDPRGTAREVSRLTIDDVKAHHARHFAADNAFSWPWATSRVVGFAPGAGAFWKLGDAEIGSPAASESRLRRPAQVTPGGSSGRTGSGGPRASGDPRNHPAFEALAVLDHILGAGPGFTDRLSRVVRDELGLAYAIGGGMTDSADILPGLFRISVGTGPDEVEQVVAAVLEQIRAMHQGDFSDEEVDRARRFLAGSWVFEYQTVEQRAERLMELERWGLPMDEPVSWPDRVSRVSTKQVRTAARTHIRPESIRRVELGPVRRRGQRPSAECA